MFELNKKDDTSRYRRFIFLYIDCWEAVFIQVSDLISEKALIEYFP